MKKGKDTQSYTKFCLKLNDINDSDIIDALWSVDNKTDYIRKLIRDDLMIGVNNGAVERYTDIFSECGGNIRLFGG
jgi:ribosomal protein S3AE